MYATFSAIESYSSVLSILNLRVRPRSVTHAHTVNSDVFNELEVMKEVFGGSRLYSIPNTLPLVGDLQEAEFDVQGGHVIVM